MNRFTPLGVLAAVFVALLPFATSRHLFYAAVNTKYFLIIGAVLLFTFIGAWLFSFGTHTVSFKNRPILWTLIAVLAVYYLSSSVGVFPERSLFSDILRSSGILFLTHIAVFAFILGEFLQERDWMFLRRTVVFSSALFSLFAIVGNEGMGISGRFLWTNLDINGFTFGNSTFAGTYLVLALIVALIEISRTSPWTRWWYALAGSTALIFFSPALFNTGLLWGKTSIASFFETPVLLLGSARASSVTAILLLFFLLGWVLFKKYAPHGSKNYALFAWAGFSVMAIIAGVALLFTPGSVIQKKYIEASTAARILVWEGSFDAIRERPFLGWGPENFDQAFQLRFDNRLWEDKNIGEIWFDRAHNIIIDTLVDVGVVGALASLLLVGAFVWVIYCARRRGVLQDTEAMLLIALPFAHFLQLQTAFDTVGSYTLLGMFLGYGLWLERGAGGARAAQARSEPEDLMHKTLAGILLILALASAKYMLFDEFVRQRALYQLFVETNVQKQVPLAQTATSRLSSFESLRLSSMSFLAGALRQVAQGKVDKPNVDLILSISHVYEDKYKQYLEVQPEYYRAHIDFAYLLSLESVLGENKLKEAKKAITQAYPLSPNHPLTFGMDALLELYSGNIAAAKKKAQAGIALNPNITFSKNVLEHIEKQEKTFPTISVMKLDKI